MHCDIQSLFSQLMAQTGGLVEADLVLVTSPAAGVGQTAVNNFNVAMADLPKKNFPSIRMESDVGYATAGGNVAQLIAKTIEGQSTRYCAFNEKLRNHPIIPGLSSFKQKKTQGSWGAIIRMPSAIATMIGV